MVILGVLLCAVALKNARQSIPQCAQHQTVYHWLNAMMFDENPWPWMHKVNEHAEKRYHVRALKEWDAIIQTRREALARIRNRGGGVVAVNETGFADTSWEDVKRVHDECDVEFLRLHPDDYWFEQRQKDLAARRAKRQNSDLTDAMPEEKSTYDTDSGTEEPDEATKKRLAGIQKLKDALPRTRLSTQSAVVCSAVESEIVLPL